MEILNENKINKEYGGIPSIYELVAMLPTGEKVEELATRWCDKYGEAWNAQHCAYIAGMNAIIDAIKSEVKTKS